MDKKVVLTALFLKNYKFSSKNLAENNKIVVY